jgi:hypothetical protein
MGLLEKRNPRATRRSVVAWASVMAIVFLAIAWALWLRTDMPFISAFFVLPWMALSGALAGGAMEWQMPDESDSEARHDGPPSSGRT